MRKATPDFMKGAALENLTYHSVSQRLTARVAAKPPLEISGLAAWPQYFAESLWLSDQASMRKASPDFMKGAALEILTSVSQRLTARVAAKPPLQILTRVRPSRS